MKRATSSVESIDRRDMASESRSSRSVTTEPVSTGSACFQSDVVVSVRAVPITAWRFVTVCAVRRAILSIRSLPQPRTLPSTALTDPEPQALPAAALTDPEPQALPAAGLRDPGPPAQPAGALTGPDPPAAPT